MYKVLFGILALGLITLNVSAEPSNLARGAFIAHFVPELGYSSDPPACGWCATYEAYYSISSFEQQINRIDTNSYRSVSWFIIAAWAEEKIWCGTELGFGDFDPGIFGFLEWTGCYPADGGLEIPTAGWPGPNEGIAFVVTGEPWAGNFVSVLWFGGYAYAYSGPGVIPIDIDPPTAFCGFSNCEAPPIPFDVVPESRGGLGINTDGIYVTPPVTPVGACCIGYDCLIYPEDECIQYGGIWIGEGTTCEPINPCIPPDGACCLPAPMGECVVLAEADCLLVQGVWQGPDTLCEPENPCVGEWVCCIPPMDCYIVGTQRECEETLFGIFHPEWTECDPNPCECSPSPVTTTSWGRLKGIFR